MEWLRDYRFTADDPDKVALSDPDPRRSNVRRVLLPLPLVLGMTRDLMSSRRISRYRL